MKILCVIPSRLHSTRLPHKPLLPIQGKPMIQRVYENACRAPWLDEIIVATDDQQIADIIERIGGKVCMTAPEIQTGSERVATVAKLYPQMDVVINHQGDEPFVKPRMLKQLVEPYFAGETPDMTTLAFPLNKENKLHDPGSVKVITDLNHHALYFSRAPIPYFRNTFESPVYHHMGLYAFRHEFLMLYQNLPQTPLEKTESLEQLRVLEHGYKIRVCFTEDQTLEINTPEEYEAAQHFHYEW